MAEVRKSKNERGMQWVRLLQIQALYVVFNCIKSYSILANPDNQTERTQRSEPRNWMGVPIPD